MSRCYIINLFPLFFPVGVSVHVSILTLTVVAGDRYFAILHPLKSRVIKRNAGLVIGERIQVFASRFGQTDLRFNLVNVYNAYIFMVQLILPMKCSVILIRRKTPMIDHGGRNG